MPPYELTLAAEADLRDIARYTLTQWGRAQSLRYAALLEERFCSIAARTVHFRSFSEHYPQVLVARCEHHYVFYIHPEGKPPRIVAVLHEKMDLVAWMAGRLGL